MDLEQTITHDDMRADAERAINGPGASLFMLGHHVLALLAENARLREALNGLRSAAEFNLGDWTNVKTRDALRAELNKVKHLNG